MEEARRCPHCMSENTPDAAICTCCGAEMDAQNAPHQLPVGALLAGRYRVGGCIGEGGFGITYAGWDETLDMKVAVKEYYPAGNVNRYNTQSLSVEPTNAESGAFFEHGRTRFLDEARTLAKFAYSANIVGVRDCFFENNTAYIVMEFLEGESLSRYLREHRTGLRLPSYVMAHVLYELALCAIEAAIVLTIVFLRNADHLPDSGIIGPRIVDMYVSFLLIIFASDLIAMLVSCIVKNENEAMTVMPFVLIVQLVMSGAVFELSGVTELISKFTISRWGLDAIGSIACTTFAVSSGAMFAGAGGWKNELDNLLKCWLLLLAFCAAYTLLAMLALKSVDRDKR